MENPLLHMGMIEPIRIDTAKILYAENDGVLIKELRSNAYMLSVNEFEKGQELIDQISECNLILVHQAFMVDYIADKFTLYGRHDCFQAVYMNKVIIKLNDDLEIRPLELNDLDIILAHYDKLSKSEIIELLETGSIFGGYKGGCLVGFVGNHLEGGIGLLEIFPEYRRMGHGKTLESYIVNRMLKKDLVPFGQILSNNENSITLHRKLGFEISEDKLYWLF